MIRSRRRPTRPRTRPVLRSEALESRRLLAVLTVNTTADANARDEFLSLREAILVANGTLDPTTLSTEEATQVAGTVNSGATNRDHIEFNIPAAGLQTIALAADLPTITDPVVIDGYTQSDASPNTLAIGNDAVLRVEINGNNFNAITINATDTTIRGLVINRSLVAIRFQGADRAEILGNFIGTDPAGTAALPNSGAISYVVGIFDESNNVRIGGTDPADRNLISGNQAGVYLLGPIESALVQGNYIGTNRDGTAALQNSLIGLYISDSGGHTVGGTAAGAGNVISGNGQWGIRIDAPGPGIVIQGNLIGTNAAGAAAIPNPEGIRIQTTSPGGGTLIGGTTAAAANVISGNTGTGIFSDNRDETGPSGNTIQGNFIGTDRTGTLDLGNGTGLVVVGRNNIVGGTTPEAGNLIAFSGGIFNSAGVEVSGVGNSILGNSIYNGAARGIVYPNGSPPIPTLNSSTATSISGSIPGATAGQTYRVEFFATPNVGQSGFPALQGKTFLGALDVTGNAGFTVNVPGGVPAGQLLTATATSQTTNSTSEFSAPLATDPDTETSSDLGLVASADQTTASPGQDVTFRFAVHNPFTGSDASNVVFTTAIPAGMTFVSIDVNGGATATTPPVGGTGTVTVTMPTLGADETLRVILVARVNPGVAGGTSLVAQGSVTSDTPDPNTNDNTASATATVVGEPLPPVDASVAATATPTTVVPGQDATFTFVVATPTDVSNIQNARFVVDVPANMTFVSFTAPAGYSVTAPPVGGTGQIVATIGTLVHNAADTFRLVARVNPGVHAGTILTARGTLTADSPDPDASNNVASAAATVQDAQPPGDITSPTVASVARYGFHRQATYLVVTFSEPMDSAAAADPANYVVTAHGVRIAPASVAYNPETNQAVLRMASRLSVFRAYRLTLSGDGLRDLAGNPLDGDRDGTPGGNARVTINRRLLAGTEADALALLPPEIARTLHHPRGPRAARRARA
jgi:uncharacterized repeat protein (TIGR01451 family)